MITYYINMNTMENLDAQIKEGAEKQAKWEQKNGGNAVEVRIVEM